MRTEADENYLKEIYALELDHEHVTTSMLADRFGYSPATITGMLKKLANLDWVVYEPYHGVTLTESGRAIALEVIRHHRLLETYLAPGLKYPLGASPRGSGKIGACAFRISGGAHR